MKNKNLANWFGIISFILGWAIVITGLILPPPGEISDSVLIVFGQVLLFVGSCIGLDNYVTYKIKALKNNETEE